MCDNNATTWETRLVSIAGLTKYQFITSENTDQSISTWEVFLLAWCPIFRSTCSIWMQHQNAAQSQHTFNTATVVSTECRVEPVNNIQIHRHTHTRLTALCPGLPASAGTREVKPIWILLKQRDSECQWHQLGYMQVCTSLQTDNHTSTPPLSFLQAGFPSCRPINSVKSLKARPKYKYM